MLYVINRVQKSHGNLVNNFLKIDYSIQYMKFPNIALNNILLNNYSLNFQEIFAPCLSHIKC